jgi:hypothetical protein
VKITTQITLKYGEWQLVPGWKSPSVVDNHVFIGYTKQVNFTTFMSEFTHCSSGEYHCYLSVFEAYVVSDFSPYFAVIIAIILGVFHRLCTGQKLSKNG